MSLASILSTYYPALLAGLWVTFKLCIIVWTASFGLGSALGIVAARSPLMSIPIRLTSAVLAGIPVIVFLFWMHYPAQAILNIIVQPFITACVALAVLGIFMVAEAVRQTLVDFPQQYIVAARVSGLSQHDTFWKIIVPIVLRGFIPSGLFIMVTLFQMSLFSSLISVEEIFRVAQRINSIVYRPVEIYTALALFCIGVSLPLHLAALALRARFGRDFSER